MKQCAIKLCSIVIVMWCQQLYFWTDCKHISWLDECTNAYFPKSTGRAVCTKEYFIVLEEGIKASLTGPSMREIYFLDNI